MKCSHTLLLMSYRYHLLLSYRYHFNCLMLLSHHPMVQHKIIKTWCTANPAQFPVTHIASSHHPSLNSIHHIIYFHPQSFVNLYFCQFNNHTKVFQFFTNILLLFSRDSDLTTSFRDVVMLKKMRWCYNISTSLFNISTSCVSKTNISTSFLNISTSQSVSDQNLKTSLNHSLLHQECYKKGHKVS